MLKIIKRCWIKSQKGLHTRVYNNFTTSQNNVYDERIGKEEFIPELDSTLGLLMDWPLFPNQKKRLIISKEKMNLFDSIGNHSRVIGLFPKKDELNRNLINNIEM